MTRYLLTAFLLASLHTSMIWAGPTFSVDPASPAIPAVPTTEGDILSAGPMVVVPDFALGLAPGDNLNALSGGREQISLNLAFSVDRVSIGTAGSAVDFESFPGAEAAGDVFTTTVGSFTNFLAVDETTLGLTPGFFGDDLDALNLSGGPVPFFSIDSLSASNGVGTLTLANDIFLGGFGAEYASGESDIGLDPFDDLDALILDDRGTPGVLDPGIDRALFSLSFFSPSTFTGGIGPYSPAEILFTDFTGAPPTVFASAASIGLDDFDDLNALSNPEPGSLALLAFGLGSFAIYRRRQKKQTAA